MPEETRPTPATARASGQPELRDPLKLLHSAAPACQDLGSEIATLLSEVTVSNFCCRVRFVIVLVTTLD